MTSSFTRHTLNLANYSGAAGVHEVVYYDWGDAAAAHTVLCVHGLTRNGRDFDLLAAALSARGRRVLCPSLPGRGESARLANPAGYTNANYVEDCLYLLDHLGITAVDWVGTSLGGLVGMAVAAAHPQRIRRLVLNDIGILVKKEALRRIYLSMRDTPERFPTRTGADEHLRSTAAGFGIAHMPALWERFFNTSFLQNADGSYSRSYDPALIDITLDTAGGLENIADIDLTVLWQHVQHPTLILRGETSDMLEAETVERMCAMNPNTRSFTIAGAGHAPALMTPDQIELLSAWLMDESADAGA